MVYFALLAGACGGFLIGFAFSDLGWRMAARLQVFVRSGTRLYMVNRVQ